MAFDTILTDKTGTNGIPQYFDTTGVPKPLTGDKAPYAQVVDANGAILFTAANPARFTLSSPIPAGANSIGSVQITDGVVPAAFLTPTNPGNVQLAGNSVALLTASGATGVSAAKAVGTFKNYVFEVWANGAFSVQIQAIGPSGIARNLKVWDELNGSFVTGSYTITAAGFYSVSVPPSVNIQANVIGNAGIAEVNSLAVTSAPTASGNVTVTLDGVATNVAVTIGTAEVDSLTITAAATTASNVTVTLNAVAATVAVLATDTAINVADKIRAATFAGWTTGGTVGTTTVTFTSTTVGVKTAPSYSAGTTGAAGTMSTPTAGVNADDATSVATKVRNTAFATWTTGGTGTTVTFTSTTTVVRADGIYSAGTTGAAGTMTTTAQGAPASVSIVGGLTQYPTSVQSTNSNPKGKETLTVAAAAVGFVSSAGAAKAFITNEAAQIRYWVDGSTPTTTSGHLVNIGDAIKLDTAGQVANFKAIAVSGTATLQITYS